MKAHSRKRQRNEERAASQPNKKKHASTQPDDLQSVQNPSPVVWIPLDNNNNHHHHDDDDEANPWGPNGYQNGDVLLYGPQRGMGHVEAVQASFAADDVTALVRYAVDPFGPQSTYRTTHSTPEDGLSLVELKRNPLFQPTTFRDRKTHGWGFEAVRDEFGHACLVQSVHIESPASTAAAAAFDGP